MLTLVGDHIAVRPNVLHSLRVAEASQRHTAQDTAIQRQLDQLRTGVGDREEGFAVGVVGQRRNVIIQPFDRLRLQHHPVAIQTNAALHRLPPGLEIEPATLEQAKLLPGPAKQQQTKGSQNKEQANKTTHRDRLDTRMANLIMNG
ncbi:hypothetical protein D3C80_1280700 [compost metagenome]